MGLTGSKALMIVTSKILIMIIVEKFMTLELWLSSKEKGWGIMWAFVGFRSMGRNYLLITCSGSIRKVLDKSNYLMSDYIIRQNLNYPKTTKKNNNLIVSRGFVFKIFAKINI